MSEVMNGNDILTSNVNPPIPVRSFDWQAVRDGYEPSDAIGYGATKQAAIDDLISKEEA